MSTIDAPFEMTNLLPKDTGLPFVVWISNKVGATHDVRVRVTWTAKAILAEMISVGIRPHVHVVEGLLDSGELELLATWIEKNYGTLISYWEGDIDTQDALGALARV